MALLTLAMVIVVIIIITYRSHIRDTFTTSFNVPVVSSAVNARLIFVGYNSAIPENAQLYADNKFIGNIVSAVPKSGSMMLLVDKVRVVPKSSVSIKWID